jgi:hypothetical protein
MPRTPVSDLTELLKLLRRIVVLAIAAYGLAREMPYAVLAVRVAILWAVLYVSSGLVDVVFRRLSYQAATSSGEEISAKNGQNTNLPAVSEKRAA